jgi:hypothetical protein
MATEQIDRRRFIKTGSAATVLWAGCCLLSRGAEERPKNTGKTSPAPARDPIAYCGLDCRICKGCQNFCRGENVSKSCAKCKMRACAMKRKEASCGSCDEYASCKLVNGHLDRNKSKKWAQDARKRLETIKAKKQRDGSGAVIGVRNPQP